MQALRCLFIVSKLHTRFVSSSAALSRISTKTRTAPSHLGATETPRLAPSRRSNRNGVDRKYYQPIKTAHKVPDIHEIRHRLAAGVKSWCQDPSAGKTLVAFGLDKRHAKLLLTHFGQFALTELSISDEDAVDVHKRWHLEELAEAFEDNLERGLYKAYLNRAVDFALGPDTPLPLTQSYHLQRLRNATNIEHPGQWYMKARSLKRKIIMHVGPTNSGKTYSALRALASANSGVYAGPLRLLAHEVWERLNCGSIMAPPHGKGIDLLDASPLNRPEEQHQQSPGRPCNLLTGEERRVVELDAPLLSCTTEMIPVSTLFDVAVIDEIQMIADKTRGSAWTRAVLGVWAKEIHLCGEPTVVDMIRRMAEETGDDFSVNYYERLSPLHVSESLGGDLRKVVKGDCVVAFSRSRIFQIKSQIEASTGMRCAVAYGRLPPEVRSEQAEKFNDEDSGFDVLVASDAIGMGLNLKIKRVIFSSITKWNGREFEHLSHNQAKQIAGRAGRFGALKNEKCGYATTLFDKDLPRLRKAMRSKNPIVARAVLELPEHLVYTVYASLPRGSGFHDVQTVLDLLTIPGPLYTPKVYAHNIEAADFIDKAGKDLTFQDAMAFLTAPVQWRDQGSRGVQKALMNAYFRDLVVKLDPLLETTGCMEAIRKARAMETKVHSDEAGRLHDASTVAGADADAGTSAEDDAETKAMLEALEPTHKLIVLYLWLSWRLPLAFRDHEAALAYKDEMERLIDFILSTMRSKRSNYASAARTQEEDIMISSKKFEWDYEVPTMRTGLVGSRTTALHLPF